MSSVLERSTLVAFAVVLAVRTARAADGAKPVRSPRADIGLGLLVSAQAIDLGADPLPLTTSHGHTFTMSGADLRRFAAMPIELRLRVGIGPVRVGPLIAAGPVFVPSVFDRRARLETYGDGTLVDFGVEFGLALPRWRRLQAEVELAAGGRFVAVPIFHPDRANTAGVSRHPIVAQPLIEPRAAVDVWLGAHATLGLWASVDAAVPDEPAVGLELTYHTMPWEQRTP